MVHFVTSLLTSYGKSENESFRCSFLSDLNHKNYYDYFPVLRLRRNIDEFLRGLPEDDRSKHFWRDFTRCSYQVNEFNQYLFSLSLHTEAYLKSFEIYYKEQEFGNLKQGTNKVVSKATSHSNEDSTYGGFPSLCLFKIFIFEAKICFPF